MPVHRRARGRKLNFSVMGRMNTESPDVRGTSVLVIAIWKPRIPDVRKKRFTMDMTYTPLKVT